MEDLIAATSRPFATRWAGRPCVLRTRTGSTNDDARVAAMAGAPHGHTIVADAQDSGRGRQGRVWHSPAGENLYLSIVLRPARAAHDVPIVTLAAGLAVRDAVAAVAKEPNVSVKWPNDVRIGGRKLAGILVEGAMRGDRLAYAVLGIGINVRGERVPDALSATATTVRMATGRVVDRGVLLEAVLLAVEQRVDEWIRDGAAGIIAAVSRNCDTLGTSVSVNGVEGRAHSIGARGELRIERADGTIVGVNAGEVVLPAPPGRADAG